LKREDFTCLNYSSILSYLISLAANNRTDAMFATRDKALRKKLEHKDALRDALAATRSLREDLRVACTELARRQHKRGVPAKEKPLWGLLNDDAFQSDLTEWFMAGGIEEGNAVRERLVERMQTVLTQANGDPSQIAFLKDGYFEAVDKPFFRTRSWRTGGTS
jgi:hypothetical protein